MKKETCHRCNKPFLKTHRWHRVHREIKILGWVIWRWSYREHRDCNQPHLNPCNPYMVKRPQMDVSVHFEPKVFFAETEHEP